ncbi:heterokaryon incompatibility protein-domain-containing protein [Pestalotiopsis sp. NC0098]|nr:heterokaryon incompatibility protein-domain-containing protein [Pestalotiopsis sp. NC0098]
MIRWHTPSCSDPIIAIDESGVSCRGCLAKYLFNQQSVPQDTHASLNIPKDRPLGQLNLRWPPAVPYTSEQERDDRDETNETIRGRDETLFSSERDPQNGAHASIYRPLETGQFRLICLDSANSQSNLIYLDLEQHSLEDCPEYEATSYAWAGEDGDDQRSGPVFIGNFYDVALQTKNCLSMLRYLRPSRGIRMVWIDAICINQSNIRERDMQVMAMRNIYRNASRVVVYLGPRTVLPSNQQHRRRFRLDELHAFEGKDTQKINELFGHRYFSRVWVIQELLLAKSLCMPLHDSDYHADSTSIKRLDINWVETKVPWFQHTAGGRMFARDEIGLLLDQTWNSEATDPRDKLFGVLGLADTAFSAHWPPGTANTKEQLDYSLLPDYTLPTQEIFIGLVAYVVIVLGQWHILERAAGQQAASGYPTWVPDREDPTIWRVPMTVKKDDYDLVRPWYEDMGLCCKKVWTIATGFPDKDIEWRHNTIFDETNSSQEHWGAEDFQKSRALMTVGNAVNEQVSIHPATAALSIKLIRIIQLSSRPRRVADLGSLRMFEFVMAQYSLLLCTALIDLDLILDDNPTWIFLRDIDNETGPTVFFLREALQGVGKATYQLIYCCRCWDLLIFCRTQLTGIRDATRSDRQKSNITYRETTRKFWNVPMQMEHANGCHDILSYGRLAYWGKPLPYETLHAATSMINVDANTGRKLLLGFPTDNLRVKDVLTFLQLLFDVDVTWSTRCQLIGERYISLVSQFSSIICSMRSPCNKDFSRHKDYHLQAKPSEDYGRLYLTIEGNVWATYKDLWGADGEYGTARSVVFVNQKITKVVEAGAQHSTYVFQGSDVIYQKGRLWEQDQQLYHWMGWSRLGSYKYGGMIDHALVNEAATVYLCIPLSELTNYMKRQELARQFNYLNKFRCITGRDESTMVKNTEDSYRGIFAHPWPESLRKEIGLIGEPCRIQIL